MENYAIVVGIDAYHERPLQGAVGDATAFAKWLKESEEITEPDNLKLITSVDFPTQKHPPTDVEINIAVGEIVASLRDKGVRGNRLYFYFSGHGLGQTFTKTSLCMRPWTAFFNAYCISTDKYLDGLAQLDIFDEFFFFFDCCRDVDVLVEGSGPRWDHPALQTVNTKYVVCFATKYGERSQEIETQEKSTDPSKKRGAFTTFLIKALQGDASDENGNISARRLIDHLHNHFKSYTTTLRYIQEADVHENLKGQDILITRVSTAPRQFNYEIEFQRTSSNVELKNGALKIVRTGPVKPGDKWQEMLPIGLCVLTDFDKPLGDKDHVKYFQNHSLNTVSNAQF
jgi:hypothetical protein